MHTPLIAVFLGTALLACGGCSRTPRGPDVPKLDAAAAARAAIAQYDANGDGKLDRTELGKCPALSDALPRADADHDGALTADEIAARIRAWFASGVRMLPGATQVTLDGKPLEGATVTFEPEAFLGDALRPARGVTDRSGQAFPRGANEQFAGVYPGAYRVRISKVVGGKETIPARYNIETELGVEIAADIPGRRLIEFALRGR